MTAAPAPPIQVHDLTVTAGERTLLNQVSLTVAPAARLLLTGNNGAGKSTLLTAIAGVRRSTSVLLLGPPNHLPAARSPLAWCPGGAHLPPAWTARELLHTRHTQVTAAGSAELLATLGLHHLLDQPVYTLSAGERQRVALALAFTGAPRIVLLDEPLEHLDEQVRGAVFTLIDALPATTFVIATHRPGDWATRATRTLHLHNARVEER